MDEKTGKVKYWNNHEEKEKEFEINDPVKGYFDPVNRINDPVIDGFDPVNFQNERVKEDLIKIYSFIEQNPLVKTASLEKVINKSNKTVKRYLKMLYAKPYPNAFV